MNCQNHGENATGSKCCGCVCHKMPGILVALIGLVLLAGNMELMSAEWVGRIWPVLLILIGVKKMCKGRCKCCHSHKAA